MKLLDELTRHLAIEWNEKEKTLGGSVAVGQKLYGQETGLQEVMLEEGPSRALTRRSRSAELYVRGWSRTPA
jgi:hypothetical protein